MSRIFLSPPEAGPAERQGVLAAIDSGWLAPAGPDLAAFEREVAQVVARRYAVALSSGTAALHLALIVHGVGPGDHVLVSDFTFAASVNAIRYVGATPVLIDSDPDTWNISPGLLAEELEARRAAPPAAAILVDLYGQAADHHAIAPHLADHGVLHLSDAAESLGATYDGAPAASFGETAALSFNGNKIITTTGGGMLVTNDAAVAERVRHLSTQARQPLVHYEHVEVGYNYRLSNILAAFGRAQLADLDRRHVLVAVAHPDAVGRVHAQVEYPCHDLVGAGLRHRRLDEIEVGTGDAAHRPPREPELSVHVAVHRTTPSRGSARPPGLGRGSPRPPHAGSDGLLHAPARREPGR